jgi:hypothetical protein
MRTNFYSYVDPSVTALTDYTKRYQNNTNRGFVTMQVNLRRVGGNSNMVYPPSYFNPKVGILQYTSGEPTEYTFTEGYKRISALLEGKRDAPLHFDDLEFAVWREMRDLFEGNHTLIQDARLVYDVLWRLHEEGRLRQKSILISGGKRLSPDDPMYADARNLPGAKNRTFMWIEDQ